MRTYFRPATASVRPFRRWFVSVLALRSIFFPVYFGRLRRPPEPPFRSVAEIRRGVMMMATERRRGEQRVRDVGRRLGVRLSPAPPLLLRFRNATSATVVFPPEKHQARRAVHEHLGQPRQQHPEHPPGAREVSGGDPVSFETSGTRAAVPHLMREPSSFRTKNTRTSSSQGMRPNEEEEDLRPRFIPLPPDSSSSAATTSSQPWAAGCMTGHAGS